MVSKRLTHEAYRVGWICALEVEQVAAMAMLDEEHESLPQPSGDTNIYGLGSINSHNVVIAGLPTPGNNPAAAVAVHLTRTFPKVHYILLVGIGGGVPVKTDQGAIRLGHVVVSKPTGIHSGAIQYDHGKATVGIFERTGSLAPPPTALLNAATALAVRRQRMDDDPIWTNIQRTQTGRRRLRHFKFPGASHDELYRPGYDHRQLDVACAEAKCDPRQRIERPMGDDEEEYYVVVHRGTIASGELVVKNASLRDQLAREYGVLCFETEAAGALTSFACLVIRGISDYCDSHKNDAWQGYAAAVAAAYARQLFFHMAIEETHK
jgi:nucleoside phosphorylase